MRPSILALSMMLAAGLSVGGCGPVNRGLTSVKQPVVGRTDYVLDMPSHALRDRDPAGVARLDAWLTGLRLGYGDHVSIDDPARSGDPELAYVVADLIGRRGLVLADEPPVTEGAIPPGSVRIVVSRTAATVPDCPDWSRPSQPEFAGSTMSNYGCATNSNLAAMIADPQDLVRGATGTGSDARSVTKAIRAWREAPTAAGAALKSEATRGGQ